MRCWKLWYSCDASLTAVNNHIYVTPYVQETFWCKLLAQKELWEYSVRYFPLCCKIWLERG